VKVTKTLRTANGQVFKTAKELLGMVEPEFLKLQRHAEKRKAAKLVPGYRPYVKLHSFPRVRCGFWLLAWANGCMYNCQYCWLKAYHPWPWGEIHTAEKSAIAKVLRRFCKRIGGSQLLNAGELCDSFIAPEYISFMASTLRAANEEYGCRHRLLLLTKSADPSVLLQGNFQDVVVYSVSVNTEPTAKQFEHDAPSPMKRINAARQIKEVGYEVRVRVDPIIAGSNLGDRIPAGSEPAYIDLMERICAFIEPSLITLGSLRATPRTYRFLPKSIREQLTEKTPWGYGYPLKARLSINNEFVTVAKDHGIPVAFCKEPGDVWRSLKLR